MAKANALQVVVVIGLTELLRPVTMVICEQNVPDAPNPKIIDVANTGE